MLSPEPEEEYQPPEEKGEAEAYEPPEDEGEKLSEPPIQDLEQDYEEQIPPVSDDQPASPEGSV